MTEHSLHAGDHVQAAYKSGTYIGELQEIKTAKAKAVVKVLAVLKHPTQGDLHNPGQADVPMFHQRKALAFGEFALVPLSSVKAYTGEIPDYLNSLHAAIDKDIATLQKQDASAFNLKAMKQLEQMRKEYS